MANVSSGSKRVWDDAETEFQKRPREEPRDWRDVHLKSPKRKAPISKRESFDRRGGLDSGRRRGGDADYRRTSDYTRDRARRDDRDSGRRDDYRRQDNYRRSPPNSPRTNGRPHPPKRDSEEKEEGE
jgi:hypothetical protein